MEFGSPEWFQAAQIISKQRAEREDIKALLQDTSTNDEEVWSFGYRSAPYRLCERLGHAQDPSIDALGLEISINARQISVRPVCNHDAADWFESAPFERAQAIAVEVVADESTLRDKHHLATKSRNWLCCCGGNKDPSKAMKALLWKEPSSLHNELALRCRDPKGDDNQK